jgi:hypothetical protein
VGLRSEVFGFVKIQENRFSPGIAGFFYAVEKTIEWLEDISRQVSSSPRYVEELEAIWIANGIFRTEFHPQIKDAYAALYLIDRRHILGRFKEVPAG